MISIKDIEVLEKFAGRLYVPLFAAACFVQPPFDFPAWLSGTAIVPSFFSLAAWVLLCIFALWAFHDAISYVDALWFRGCLYPVFGFALVAFGVLVFCKLGGKDPFASLNPLWNLASLAYGLLLLQISDPMRQGQHNA
jgi:hypothetical protein